jgi:hypothetical protein
LDLLGNVAGGFANQQDICNYRINRLFVSLKILKRHLAGVSLDLIN